MVYTRTAVNRALIGELDTTIDESNRGNGEKNSHSSVTISSSLRTPTNISKGLNLKSTGGKAVYSQTCG